MRKHAEPLHPSRVTVARRRPMHRDSWLLPRLWPAHERHVVISGRGRAGMRRSATTPPAKHPRFIHGDPTTEDRQMPYFSRGGVDRVVKSNNRKRLQHHEDPFLSCVGWPTSRSNHARHVMSAISSWEREVEVYFSSFTKSVRSRLSRYLSAATLEYNPVPNHRKPLATQSTKTNDNAD